jgi:hypothetical protein
MEAKDGRLPSLGVCGDGSLIKPFFLQTPPSAAIQ